MLGTAPCASIRSRMPSASYALSARTMVSGSRRSSRRCAAGPSWACPGVRPSLIGSPWASTTAWILVVSHPGSDRDNDLDPPFCRRSLLVRPDGSAVDHLDVAVIRSGDGVHHPAPHACFAPSHEAVVAGSARAIALGQVAPRCARSQYP